MTITPFDVAMRFVGTKEIPGTMSNPLVLAMLQLDASWVASDDVAWCSAFTNFVCWLLRLPRSKSLAARSWLQVGRPITLVEAVADSDIVVLQRGAGVQPGPEVIQAPGHVAFFAGLEGSRLLLLGGNQSDAVNIAGFPVASVLGVRRLA